MNISDSTNLFAKSKRNIDIELSQLPDISSQLEWLIEHLGIYLRRLAGFCDELGKLPEDFLESSLFFNIQVASNHIERILRDQARIDCTWSALTESLSELPDAHSMKQCLSCFDGFRQHESTT